MRVAGGRVDLDLAHVAAVRPRRAADAAGRVDVDPRVGLLAGEREEVDAEVGAGANIGAGTITCNYDGYFKHKTVIGERAFIGSNSALIAPVRIGADAIVAAGSAVSRDVADGELRLVRAEQMVKPGWADRFHDAMKRKKAEKAEKGRS